MGDEIELVTLPPSPWTMMVEWALNHHNINYKSTTYTPLLGEGWLRRKTGKKEGLITVPVMFTPDGTLMDSFDIAQWADKHSQVGDAAKLFPDGQLEALHKWNRASNDILEYWRAVFFTKIQNDKMMRRGMVPPVLNSLGPITDWLSSKMINSFSTKYDEVSRASSAAKAEEAYEELRKAVEANNGYVLGKFSYADIVMAVAANSIDPIGPPISKAPEVMRRPHPDLKAKYGDLVEYKDRIFKKHFPPRA